MLSLRPPRLTSLRSRQPQGRITARPPHPPIPAYPTPGHAARPRHARAHAATARPPLTSPAAPPPLRRAAFDVAVLGGGTLGLLTAAAAAREGARVVWLRSGQDVQFPSTPAPPRFRPARAAAADGVVVALAADGLAAWEALGLAGRSADAPYTALGCLDIAGRGPPGDALDAAADAVRPSFPGATCLAGGELSSRVRGLALPRGATGLWLPPGSAGGGVLDAVCARVAAQADARAAGVAVWGDAACGGWRDKGSHFQLWAALEDASSPTSTAVIEAERLVLMPGPVATTTPGPPRAEDKEGGGEPTFISSAGVGCPTFGLALPGATLRWPAWASGVAGSGTAPLPCIFCHGLGADGGDSPAGGAHESWVAFPTSTAPIVLRPPGAALRLPPWPTRAATSADAAAAATAASIALGYGLVTLPRGGGAAAAAAAGGGWPAVETADGRPILGWAPPGGGGMGGEEGRVLLVASAVGGAAGSVDGGAASPALARLAGRVVGGWRGNPLFEPGRAGVGASAGPPPAADTWENRT